MGTIFYAVTETEFADWLRNSALHSTLIFISGLSVFTPLILCVIAKFPRTCRKDVEIVGYNDDILIRDITVATNPQPSYWDVQVKVYVEAYSGLASNLNGVLQVALATSSAKVISVVQNVVYDASAPGKENNYTVQMNVPKVSESTCPKIVYTRKEDSYVCVVNFQQQVELWWPNGFGNQPLYNLTATVSTSTSSFTKTIAIGFRTIELRQDMMDAKDPQKGISGCAVAVVDMFNPAYVEWFIDISGASFYFTVNGVPIFAKGSNLVPVDVLPERASDENTIKHLLLSSKLANMNMLRVWGGGMYLSDYFYQVTISKTIHDMCNLAHEGALLSTTSS